MLGVRGAAGGCIVNLNASLAPGSVGASTLKKKTGKKLNSVGIYMCVCVRVCACVCVYILTKSMRASANIM